MLRLKHLQGLAIPVHLQFMFQSNKGALYENADTPGEYYQKVFMGDTTGFGYFKLTELPEGVAFDAIPYYPDQIEEIMED